MKIDPARISRCDLHEILVAVIQPRSIAWVSSVDDKGIFNLARKVHHVVTVDSQYPWKMYGWVQIRMKDGKEYEDKMFLAKAPATNPITDDEIRKTFRKNASKALPKLKIKELMHAMEGLDEAKDVTRVMAHCR